MTLAADHKIPLIVGAIIATVRIGVLWFLTWLKVTDSETLSALPLIVLLLPEGLIVPEWSNPIAFAITLSTLLLAGSLVGTVFVSYTIRGASGALTSAVKNLTRRWTRPA
jgi:hypothetical protein